MSDRITHVNGTDVTYKPMAEVTNMIKEAHHKVEFVIVPKKKRKPKNPKLEASEQPTSAGQHKNIVVLTRPSRNVGFGFTMTRHRDNESIQDTQY